MSYQAIDSIINEWAQKHCLHIYNSYQNDEVRSTDIVDQSGRKFQIWVDQPNSNGEIEVHTWDYKKRKKDYRADSETLLRCLDKTFAEVSKWIGK